MRYQVPKSVFGILALFAVTMTTLAFERVDIAIQMLHPSTSTDTVSLDLRDVKNLPPDCGTDGFCIYSVQGTVDYSAPNGGVIQCLLSGLKTGYSKTVEIGTHQDGSLTLTATSPERGKVHDDDAVPFFGCTMDDGSGTAHLEVSMKKTHDEAKVPFIP